MKRFYPTFSAIVILLLGMTLSSDALAQSSVVAFWGFKDPYDFTATNPKKEDFAPDVNNTVGSPNLQAFRGDPDDLDDNGGDGFVAYTSSVSGATYEPTRTIKWDDLKGGGDDFDINGTATFSVDKLDGLGPVTDEDFGNDALIYLTLDGSDFVDFEFRFDVEGTPGDLPASFDVFYRTTGTGGTWFRDSYLNNIPLTFSDHTPADPENQFADSGMIALPAALNNQSQIEIIVNDFAELGNGEMEIDNFEIIAKVPEPSGIGMILLAGLAIPGWCRPRRRKTALQ